MRKQLIAAMAILMVSQAALAADNVTINKPVTFNEDADIATSVKKECELTDELPDAIVESAKDNGIIVARSSDAPAETKGRVLDLEIYEAVVDGNSFTGHHKSMGVKGKLLENGEVIGTFRDRRNSMGGAFGAFKGSCGVLVRITKEIGDDVGKWLKAPTQGAKLGDLD